MVIAIRILFFVVRVKIYDVMNAIGEMNERFEIYIGFFGPITGGLFVYLLTDPVNEYFVDLFVCAASVVGF